MTGHVSHSDHDLNGLVQDIIDNTSSVIYVKDLSYRYRLINRQFEKLFKIKRADIVAKTDYECFPKELADAFRKNDTLVLETGQSIECEEDAPHEDGRHTYLSLKFPLLDSDGRVEAIAGISTDVTERLRSRREIESLKHRYELILGSVTDGICGLDEEGRIVFLNSAAERLLGWKIDELRGICRSHFVVPATLDVGSSHDCAIASALRGEEPRIADARFRRKDGSLIPVEYVANPIREAGRFVGVVITFRDISERLEKLRVEQELRTAHRVQQALYPQSVPVLPRLDIAGKSVPSRFACGDYYDFLPSKGTSLLVAVGDVSGHGLGPALEMVGMRASLRAVADSEPDLGRCMSRLNRILSMELPDEMFVTLLMVWFDPTARSLIYSAAGHEAIIVRTDDSMEKLQSTGMVLGLDATARFGVSQPIVLCPGDVVVIPTDGLTETMSPDLQIFGWERVRRVIAENRFKSAEAILDELCASACRYANGIAQHDDVTAVVVKVL